MPKRALWDDDLINELVNYIKVGNYVGTACAAVGVNTSTYYRWVQTGAQVEELVAGRDDEDEIKDRMIDGELVLGLSAEQVRCWNVRREITKATALGEAYAVAMVRTQMPQQWTAAMTFLERRFPQRWKRRDQLDIGAGDDSQSGIDEQLLLEDPKAVALIHEALAMVSKELPPPDAEVVQDDKSPADESAGPLG